jgi:hypothetical protein
MSSNKLYEFRGKTMNEHLALLKWLRANNVDHLITNNEAFKIHQLNNYKIVIEFLSSRLELEYIMQHEWAKNDTDI